MQGRGARRRRLSWAFLGLFLTGLVIRVAALPLAGTSDVTIFKIWTYNAAALGPTEVYGRGGTPPEWRWLTYNGDRAQVDYPPIVLFVLAGVGRLYQALLPAFPDGRGLTVAIKLPALVADLGLAVLVLAAVSRSAGSATGRLAALTYWLNPAVILQGAVLGYVDALCALPAVAALVAASRGIWWAAGGWLALACLTKPQGLLVAPAIILALARVGGGWRAVLPAVAASAMVTVACLWPFIQAGTLSNMAVAVARLLSDGSLSANAANAWWLVTYAGQTMARGGEDSSWLTALTTEVDYVSVRAWLRNADADSSVGAIAVVAGFAWATVLAAVAWAMWQSRHATDRLGSLAQVGAFTVHAYFVLSVQVHENHLFLALPLLAIVAALRPRYRGLAAVVSLIAALNLYLFYGWGTDVGFTTERSVTGIDATVLLAALNCAAFAWHAVTFRRECAAAADAISA